MIKAITGTALSRIVVMISGFLVLFINARYFGAEGVGTIGLIVLAVAINTLLGGLVGGGAVVYLAPRFEFFYLAIPAYVWSIVSSALGTYSLLYLRLIPEGFGLHILLISIAGSINQLHLNGLLGYKKIAIFNLLSILQSLLLIVFLYVFAQRGNGILSFVFAMYVSQLGVLFAGTVLLLKRLAFRNINGFDKSIPALLRLGIYVQLANIIQLFNYRLIYYIIDIQLGRAMLGVFDLSNKVAEGVWMTGKSVATVQYSRIANEKEPDVAVNLTMKLFKFTFVISFATMMILLLIPSNLYLYVFGADFTGVKEILLYLAPGIVLVSTGMTISHYFAGIGLHRINTFGSLIGLIVLAFFAWMLVPIMKLTGAALAVSAGYTASFFYSYFVFIYQSGCKKSSLLIRYSDFSDFLGVIRKILKY
jgi:O-antigen/teichoic acid export membrane protein